MTQSPRGVRWREGTGGGWPPFEPDEATAMKVMSGRIEPWICRTVAGALVVQFAVAVSGAVAGDVPVAICGIVEVLAEPRDEESVLDFVRSYEATLASGRAERIAALYADLPESRRGFLEHYFAAVVSNLGIRLDEVRIAVDGDGAQVSFDRTDSFTDRQSGHPVEKSVRIARRLQRRGEGWRIVLGDID